MALEIRSLRIQNFRSIKYEELGPLPQFGVVVGKNGSGKSNLFDALVFLREASSSYLAALQRRGGWRQMVFRKQVESEVTIDVEIAVGEPDRQALIRSLRKNGERPTDNQGISDNTIAQLIASQFATTLRYVLRIGDATQEALYAHNVGAVGGEVTIANSVQPTPGGGGHFEIRQYAFAKLEHTSWSGALPNLLERFSSGGNQELVVLGTGGSLSNDVRNFSDALRRVVGGIVWISPERKSEASQSAQTAGSLAPDASNLASVLYTLRNNRERVFQRVREEMDKLVPGSRELFTPISESAVTIAIGDEVVSVKLRTFVEKPSGGRSMG